MMKLDTEKYVAFISHNDSVVTMKINYETDNEFGNIDCPNNLIGTVYKGPIDVIYNKNKIRYIIFDSKEDFIKFNGRIDDFNEKIKSLNNDINKTKLEIKNLFKNEK